MNGSNCRLESWCKRRIQLWVIVAVALAGVGGCQPKDTPPPPPDPFDFPNLLNVRGVPAEPRDLSVNSFSDQGAWFSFGLPDYTARETWGGFTGPFLLTHGGTWLDLGLGKQHLQPSRRLARRD